MIVELAPAPSPRWPELTAHAFQHAGFAEASRRLGLRPWYVELGRQAALVQVRSPLRGAGRLLGRAYVYPSHEDRAFLGAVVAAVRRHGIPFVRIGNTMAGVRDRASLAHLAGDARIVERHTPVIDLAPGEDALLAATDDLARRIRKAAREGVVLSEATTPADLRDYHALAKTTADRIRSRTSFTEFPLPFFTELWDRLAPAGAARLFLARVHGELVAGIVTLVHGDTMLYYHGASTRDRAHTQRQAPTACMWAAIRGARASGLARFDLGGFTPGSEPDDSRAGVYAFKRRWGGRDDTFYTAEIALAPLVCALHERVAAPLWQRLHPLLWKLTA